MFWKRLPPARGRRNFWWRWAMPAGIPGSLKMKCVKTPGSTSWPALTSCLILPSICAGSRRWPGWELMWPCCSQLVAMPDSRAALLGVDFGQRTTGFAIGHRLTATARPLSPVSHRNVDTLLKQIESLVAEWAPAAVVIGLPLAMDGSETDMSRRARDRSEERRVGKECRSRWCG